MKIGNREFDTDNKTYIMAVLNLTPDSFSDGGSYKSLDDVRFRVEAMIKEGADIIDIGGESTRPGYTMISCEEETGRVMPALECIKKEFDIPVSVDTYKPEVAADSIDAGCDMINDIWGLKYDRRMAKIIAESGVACLLMHNSHNAVYENFLYECLDGLSDSLNIAFNAGIRKGKIVLDPGIGFAKSYQENLQVLKHLGQFKILGMPMLLGCSRKSVIGYTLGLPTDQRTEGTIVTSVYAVQAHFAFVRVHDVAANKRAVAMTMAIRDAQ